MRDASPPAHSETTFRHIVGSVRSRLFAALILAAMPGVVFGALEAQRNYRVASRQEALVRNDDAARAAVRLDDLVKSAGDQAMIVATRREVRDMSAPCSASLRAALDAGVGYAAFVRVNAVGRVVCTSSSLSEKQAEFGETDWFGALKNGAPRAVSTLVQTPFGPESAIIVAAPLRARARFDGALLAVVSKSMLQRKVAMELGQDVGAIVAYDRHGALLTAAARDVDVGAASNAAALALASAKGSSTADGLFAEHVTAPGDAFTIVSVTPQGQQTEIGLRAALILLAPVLVAALSFAFVWLALDWWVLRWFYQLKDMAADFGAGRYAPAAMHGAPSEIGDLAKAFDTAVADAQTRERDLAAALVANQSLTRELHHRVKNNLQVLASLVSRQQRRAGESVVREALSEARARMTPVALAYRFINPPEDRTQLDAGAYLRELTRQLHVALSGDARGISLHIETEAGLCGADDATNIGLIVAEALITGYANAAPGQESEAVVQWSGDDKTGHKLSVGVRGPHAADAPERPLDRTLIDEVARQLNAEVAVDGPMTTLTWKPAQSSMAAG